jgi:hypothetical protein
MFIYLSNCFRIFYGLENKLELKLKENKRGVLKDDENLLGYVLGKNVKLSEINQLEIFKVILCENNKQQNTSTINE